MKKLDEVIIIRPFIIMSIVLCHAFAPWSGAWKPIADIQKFDFYFWVGKFSFSFMIPMFVFISGYIWAYQIEVQRKIFTFAEIVKKKVQRLYLPSIVGGVFYCLLFETGTSLQDIILKLLSGYGHLWFLPMLFWLFCLSWFIIKINNPYIKLGLIAMIYFLGGFNMPFNITRSFSYVPYFFFGYESFKIKIKLIKYAKCNVIVLFFLLFIMIFALYTMCFEINTFHGQYVYERYLFNILKTFIHLLYNILGIIWLYLFSLNIIKIITRIPQSLYVINSYCFGVYLVHQFLLQYLYYHTTIIENIETDLLPWISFIIVLMLSLLFTHTIKRTEIGKFIC